MCCTCYNVRHMSVMIQIRNVPDALHRRLKSRAAMRGLSLSDYLLREIREVAERPTIEEVRRRLQELPPVVPDESPADVIRAERDSR
jgi:antitoxin FitA